MENIQPLSLNFVRTVRNNLLVHSDTVISELEDKIEIARWMEYRTKLRNFFIDKDETYFSNNKLIWPKTPTDIDALKNLAAAGDTEAQEIIQREGL
jgi:hypothetical protein